MVDSQGKALKAQGSFQRMILQLEFSRETGAAHFCRSKLYGADPYFSACGENKVYRKRLQFISQYFLNSIFVLIF